MKQEPTIPNTSQAMSTSPLKMKNPQIGFHKTMHGIYKKDLGSAAKQFDFTVNARAPLKRIINPFDSKFMLADLEGKVTMAGICNDAPISNGSLMLDFFRQRALIYTFEFNAGGREFTYCGIKNLHIEKPIKSMTCLYGVIKEPDGDRMKNVWPAESYFKLIELPGFLLSLVNGLNFK